MLRPATSAPRPRPAPFLAWLVGLGMMATVACGYQSLIEPTSGPNRGAGHGRSSSSEPTRLAVIALRNDSPEPWLDRIVNDAMRREMGRRGAIDLVSDPRGADLVLRGRIRPLDIRSQSFSTFVAALEYALTVQLDLEIIRSGGQIIRLDSRMLSETDVYLASADIEVTRSNRLEVLRRLSDILASRVADSIELIERPIESESSSDETSDAGGIDVEEVDTRTPRDEASG